MEFQFKVQSTFERFINKIIQNVVIDSSPSVTLRATSNAPDYQRRANHFGLTAYELNS